MTTDTAQQTSTDRRPGNAPAEWLADFGLLERPARWLAERSARQHGRLADVLRGRPLGHALHPALTDLPIGFWTSGVVLDIVGGRRSAAAAQRLIGLGVLSAVPTALAGAADVPTLGSRPRRVAIVHAASNATALALFTRSWWGRLRGRHRSGVIDGLLASSVATFGGYLGGWMAFGDHTGKGDKRDATGVPPVSRLRAVP